MTGALAYEPGATLTQANGQPITDHNAELQAFHAYLKTERRTPDSVDALRGWVRATAGRPAVQTSSGGWVTHPSPHERSAP